jgi:hypothetical protein
MVHWRAFFDLIVKKLVLSKVSQDNMFYLGWRAHAFFANPPEDINRSTEEYCTFLENDFETFTKIYEYLP